MPEFAGANCMPVGKTVVWLSAIMEAMLVKSISKLRDRVLGPLVRKSDPTSRSNRKNAMALLLVALMAVMGMSAFFGYRVYGLVKNGSVVDLAGVVLMGVVLFVVMAGVVRMWWSIRKVFQEVAVAATSGGLDDGPDDDGVVGSGNGDGDIAGGC